MKVFKTLALMAGIASVAGVQAAATGEMNIVIDWGTMSISGPLTTPTTFTFPGEGTFFSDAEGWASGESGDLDSVYAVDGASAIASYSDTVRNLTGGYDSTTDKAFGNVAITNTGPGFYNFAGGWRGFFYEATGDGSVTVSVNYTLSGDISSDAGYSAQAGYDVFMDSVDADLWLSIYNSIIQSGGDAAAAEITADEAATLDEYSFSNYNLLECLGGILCQDSTTLNGVLSVTFDVASGTRYAFGAEADAFVYAGNSVPAPPVNLSGTIKTPNGNDICAMVLASGQFMFSCNPAGVFSLTDLPRAPDGTVKRQIYAQGFFPKIDVLTGSSIDEAVVMTRSGTCPNYNVPSAPGFLPDSAGKWIDISGSVLRQNTQTPVCAMVLASGQHMFSCDGTGSYDLRIPLDSNGQYKLQVYADGFAPTIQRFDEFSTDNTVRMARAIECQAP